MIWHKFYIWQELLIPVALGALTILISSAIIKSVNSSDVEYNGYIIVKARYYEYWSTWVDQTCSYTTCNGTDKDGNCTGYTTHYYDCSYCDKNKAYWVAIDNFGHEFDISKEYYNFLKSKWSATPQFVELDRSINKHWTCGKDGDMYEIYWNQLPETSEASVLTHQFTNKLKINHSAFNFPKVSEEQARKQGLYDYPDFYQFYKQKCILGLDSFNITGKEKIHTMFEYLNGNLGPVNRIKIFTLLFKNKPIDIAFKQEAYWQGGNQNELVVCIGLNDTLGIDWVKPFSWCDNKRILVDTREDIAELKTFKPDSIYKIYETNTKKFFKYKSFKDFNYLSFEPTTGQLIWITILVILFSILGIWFSVKNEFND